MESNKKKDQVMEAITHRGSLKSGGKKGVSLLHIVKKLTNKRTAQEISSKNGTGKGSDNLPKTLGGSNGNLPVGLKGNGNLPSGLKK